MVNGIVTPSLRSLYFGFQGFDPGIEFAHGKGIEILPRQRCQNVIGLARLIFFHIHLRNVDPNPHSVNKDANLLIAFFAAVQHRARSSSQWLRKRANCNPFLLT